MMWRLLIFIGVLLSCVSCDLFLPTPKEIYYTLGDVTIKRVDRDNEVTLYYMENGQRVDSVWCYPGEWLPATIAFDADRRVWASVFEKDSVNHDIDKFRSFRWGAPDHQLSGGDWDSLVKLGRTYRLSMPSGGVYYEIYRNLNLFDSEPKSLVKVTPIYRFESSAE